MYRMYPVYFIYIYVCVYRYLQTKRGAVPFVICKVEYIPPVMAVYFRPLNKVSVGNIYYIQC